MTHSDTIKHVYEAFLRQDIPAILARLSESVEWGYGEGTTDVPWLQHRRGLAGAAEFFASLEGLAIERFDRKMFLEQERTVVVLLDIEAVVKATGVRAFQEDAVHIFRFDPHGKIARFRHQVDTYLHYKAFHGKAVR